MFTAVITEYADGTCYAADTTAWAIVDAVEGDLPEHKRKRMISFMSHIIQFYSGDDLNNSKMAGEVSHQSTQNDYNIIGTTECMVNLKLIASLRLCMMMVTMVLRIILYQDSLSHMMLNF